MRAMRADSFTGYGGLKLVDLPKPVVADGRVLVRITAAGVTPLDHTILSGGYPRATAPLVLGNEGAGVVHDPGDSAFSVGARVMFTGPYGVFEDGTYSEWIAVRGEHLCPIPDKIDDATAGDKRDLQQNQVIRIVEPQERARMKEPAPRQHVNDLEEVFRWDVQGADEALVNRAGYFGESSVVILSFEDVECGDRHGKSPLSVTYCVTLRRRSSGDGGA